MEKYIKKMQNDIAALQSALDNYVAKKSSESKAEEQPEDKTVEQKKPAFKRMGTTQLMIHPQVFSSEEDAKKAASDPELAAILGKIKDLFEGA